RSRPPIRPEARRRSATCRSGRAATASRETRTRPAAARRSPGRGCRGGRSRMYGRSGSSGEWRWGARCAPLLLRSLRVLHGFVDALLELVDRLLRLAGLVLVLRELLREGVQRVLVLGEELAVVREGRVDLLLLLGRLGALLLEAVEHRLEGLLRLGVLRLVVLLLHLLVRRVHRRVQHLSHLLRVRGRARGEDLPLHPLILGRVVVEVLRGAEVGGQHLR